ncbi:hypothetical protein [Brasilonema sp. UFV-L1]|uniref:hypothetical protein n=1 Tax=Brasilonema sp. UFV-L1 TaxID=2234130 RepID=UPI00145D40A7|nr:hypothetical protein [Brasilonema sp. UFV-L1]NMG11942.1 hypothetical protein [Brasilonema sp. UFV-L1]
MTTKRQTSAKVRNTKAQYRTGKNQVSESQLTVGFSPQRSTKDGKARLTFCGIEHTTITVNGNEKPVMRLVFSCLDETHESPQNIAITCDYRLSENNKLGQVLAIMGYEIKKSVETVDDDDEYGVKTTIVNPREIFDFFRSKCGLVFKGNLLVATRKDKATGERVPAPGLWDIDYKSLTPKLKNGEQERDMLASDVSDEDFENPEIAMFDDE